MTRDGTTYELKPTSGNGWLLGRVAVSGGVKTKGQERLAARTYHARLDVALTELLDRMLRDGLEPGADLTETVATVAHLYATIGRRVET